MSEAVNEIHLYGIYENGIIQWEKIEKEIKSIKVPGLTSRDLLVYALLCCGMY